MAFDNNRNKRILTSRLIGDVPPFRCNTLYVNSLVTLNLIQMMEGSMIWKTDLWLRTLKLQLTGASPVL